MQGYLYAGTNSGIILSMDLNTGRIIDEVQGTGAGISCSLLPLADLILAGTAAGEILALKYITAE